MCTFIGYLALNESYLNKMKIEKQIKNEIKLDYYLSKTLLPNQSFEQELYCRLPKLSYIGHLNHETNYKCKLEHEWGYLKHNRWHLNKTVVQFFKFIKCKYKIIERINDHLNNQSAYFNLQDNQLILNETIEVYCTALNGYLNLKKKYKNLHVQIVSKLTPNNNNNNKANTDQCKPMNIILLSYDSLSRVSWFKRIPKTTEYILNKMNFKLLYGHSILGDGTPACMIPLLTGRLENELPSTLKSDPNGTFVDQAYPFLFNELKANNYYSFHMEDWPQVSAFTYRLRGMSNNTAHHYMRAYQTHLWSKVSSAYFSNRDDFCIGSVKRHKKALNLLTDFIQTYSNTTTTQSHHHIGIMHYIENSHDSNDRGWQIDNDLLQFLMDNFKENNFQNTAILLYSDHGQRFSAERLSQQGYLEERMPFVSIYLPDQYRKENPVKFNNLIKNSQQLTTALDIYQTLRELTCLSPFKNDTNKIRSISLLESIPFNRTCKDIGLSLHFCICELDWGSLDVNDAIAQQAIHFVIKYMNSVIVKPVNDLCEYLQLDRLITVQTVKIESSNFFKLNFATLPNYANYEAMLKLDKYEKFAIESPDFISRTNTYGNQPKCLENTPKRHSFFIDMRKFCLCKIK